MRLSPLPDLVELPSDQMEALEQASRASSGRDPESGESDHSSVKRHPGHRVVL